MTYLEQYKVMIGGLLRENGFKYTFTNLNQAASFRCKHVDFRKCTLYWLGQSAREKAHWRVQTDVDEREGAREREREREKERQNCYR